MLSLKSCRLVPLCLFFETGSLIGLQFTSWSEAWGCPVSDLPSTGVVSMRHHTNFACGLWGLNPGHHACNANTSLTEPSSWVETKKKSHWRFYRQGRSGNPNQVSLNISLMLTTRLISKSEKNSSPRRSFTTNLSPGSFTPHFISWVFYESLR